jgi:hypothetical protein
MLARERLYLLELYSYLRVIYVCKDLRLRKKYTRYGKNLDHAIASGDIFLPILHEYRLRNGQAGRVLAKKANPIGAGKVR